MVDGFGEVGAKGGEVHVFVSGGGLEAVFGAFEFVIRYGVGSGEHLCLLQKHGTCAVDVGVGFGGDAACKNQIARMFASRYRGIGGGEQSRAHDKPLEKARAAACREYVGNGVGGIVAAGAIGVHAEGHGYECLRHIVVDGDAFGYGGPRVVDKTAGCYVAGGDGAEVFLGEGARTLFGDISHDGEHGVVGGIVGIEPAAHVVLLHCGDMLGAYAYHRPTVGVTRVEQRAQGVRHAAIGAVEACLFKFFYHYRALHFEGAVAERQGEHTVAFGIKGRLGVDGRHHVVEHGEVGAGKGVVRPSGGVERTVEIGHVGASAKHEMLEKMSHARLPGVFVAGACVVEHGEHHGGGVAIVHVHHAQSIVESKLHGIFI